jgi:putative addiction module antidote
MLYDTEVNMFAFKLTTVGSSLGFIVPKAAQEYLKIKKGDTVYLTEAPEGTLCLTPYSPDFERQMKLAERIMDADREMLRMLAK